MKTSHWFRENVCSNRWIHIRHEPTMLHWACSHLLRGLRNLFTDTAAILIPLFQIVIMGIVGGKYILICSLNIPSGDVPEINRNKNGPHIGKEARFLYIEIVFAKKKKKKKNIVLPALKASANSGN